MTGAPLGDKHALLVGGPVGELEQAPPALFQRGGDGDAVFVK